MVKPEKQKGDWAGGVKLGVIGGYMVFKALDWQMGKGVSVDKKRLAHQELKLGTVRVGGLRDEEEPAMLSARKEPEKYGAPEIKCRNVSWKKEENWAKYCC